MLVFPQNKFQIHCSFLSKRTSLSYKQSSNLRKVNSSSRRAEFLYFSALQQYRYPMKRCLVCSSLLLTSHLCLRSRLVPQFHKLYGGGYPNIRLFSTFISYSDRFIIYTGTHPNTWVSFVNFLSFHIALLISIFQFYLPFFPWSYFGVVCVNLGTEFVLNGKRTTYLL